MGKWLSQEEISIAAMMIQKTILELFSGATGQVTTDRVYWNNLKTCNFLCV